MKIIKKKLSKQAKWQLFFLITATPFLIYSEICLLGFSIIFYIILFLTIFSIFSIFLIIKNKKGLFEIIDEILEEEEKDQKEKKENTMEELLT